MLDNYKKHVEERAKENIPPLPLDVEQTSELINLLKSEHDESELLLFLLKERVPAGVDQSAYVKAAFLSDIASGKTSSPYIDKKKAVQILGVLTITITGTNGKSTTSKLLYDILKKHHYDTRLTGNIGNPILEEKRVTKLLFLYNF